MPHKIQLSYRSMMSLVGFNTYALEQNIHLYRLGKQCKTCQKLVVHRQCISVCNCYLFAHKKCLIQQLQQMNISECTKINCQSCQNIVKTNIQIQYNFQPKITVKDLSILIVYLIICTITMIYLINFKNQQNLKVEEQLKANNKPQQIPFITFQEICILIIMTVFGSAFWLQLIGVFFKKCIRVHQIVGTNIQIKVSAFESLEQQIREESQQQIFYKKQKQQL